MEIQAIGSKLVSGQGIGDAIIIGKTVIVSSAVDASQKIVESSVLVAKTINEDYLPAIERASALIVEDGGLVSYAAIMGVSIGIPVIVGAKNATQLITNEEIVTIDSRHGVVYYGALNIS